MPYSDSNPERRNLTVLSLGIIIFYIGGGCITSNTINLPLLNIHFTNKLALTVMIWSMLCWFLFRYIVTNRKIYGKSLDEYKAFTNLDYAMVRNYLLPTIPPNFKYTRVAIFNDINNYWKAHSGHNNEVKLSGIKGYILIKIYLIKVFFKHQATSDYYTPYVLFIVAVSLGIFNK